MPGEKTEGDENERASCTNTQNICSFLLSWIRGMGVLLLQTNGIRQPNRSFLPHWLLSYTSLRSAMPYDEYQGLENQDL